MVNAGITPLNATSVNQALKFTPHFPKNSIFDNFPKKSKDTQNKEKKTFLSRK
jgi:hypothetical protein